MKMRILALALVLLMVLSLAACGTPAPAPTQDVEPDIEDISPEPDEPPAPEPEGDTKVMSYFTEVLSGGSYTMETKMDFDGVTTVILTANDGDNVYTKSEMDGQESIFIIKDDYQYLLDPATKTCIKMPAADMEDVQKLFDDSMDTYTVAIDAGNVDIAGKTYSYEEYSVEGMTAKYCFDGDTLKYIITELEGQTITQEILRLEKGADKSLFEVPSDYTIMEY